MKATKELYLFSKSFHETPTLHLFQVSDVFDCLLKAKHSSSKFSLVDIDITDRGRFILLDRSGMMQIVQIELSCKSYTCNSCLANLRNFVDRICIWKLIMGS